MNFTNLTCCALQKEHTDDHDDDDDDDDGDGDAQWGCLQSFSHEKLQLDSNYFEISEGSFLSGLCDQGFASLTSMGSHSNRCCIKVKKLREEFLKVFKPFFHYFIKI